MSDSVRPCRQRPTRLSRPWDSPGKNTGVGCHFLLQYIKGKSESEVTQCVWLLATPWSATYQAPPSMGFSRQEYWSGVPLPSPIKLLILLNSKIKMWKCKQNTNELTFKSLSSNRTTSFGIKSQKLNINSDLKRIYWLFLLKCYN